MRGFSSIDACKCRQTAPLNEEIFNVAGRGHGTENLK